MIAHIVTSFSFLPVGLYALVVLAFACFGVFIVIDIILSVIWVINQVKNVVRLL